MSQAPLLRNTIRCWREAACKSRSITQQRRCLSIQMTPDPVKKLDLPPGIPQQYWSQLPRRLRPDKVKREIVVHPSPPSERAACKEPLKFVDEAEMKKLDPTGARTRLFDPRNPEGAKAGDIILATFKSGEPFSGTAISVKWRGPHTSVLLRNQVTRIGTEMLVKVFSPLVQSMEVVQKAVKRPRRARLYYLRKPEHDPGSVQKIVDQYVRQRALLMGGKEKGAQGRRVEGKRGRKNK